MNPCRLALAFLVLLGCSPLPHHSAVLFAAPRCDSMPDLGPAVNAQTRDLEAALDQAGVSHIRAVGSVSMEAASDGPQLVFYSGHGIRPTDKAPAVLCIEGTPISPLDLLPGRPGQASTLVLNACHAAHVDLRSIDRTVSVLSSSPVSQGVDSGFAQAVAAAISSPDLDANCDGIITDIELYRAIERTIRTLEYVQEIVPQVELRSYPGLRRHARGQVPLPIATRCRDIKPAPMSLVRDREAALAAGLLAQQAYAQGKTTTFPEFGWDYVVFSRRADVPTSVEAEVAAAILPPERQGMLRRFDGTLEEARAIASYAAFTELYLVELLTPYVRISRLSDGYRIYVGRFDQQSIAAHFPYRKQEVPDSQGRPQLIVRDRWLLRDGPGSDWQAVPCETTTGAECFVPKNATPASRSGIPPTKGRP